MFEIELVECNQGQVVVLGRVKFTTIKCDDV